MSKSLHKSLESKLAMLDGPEWESDDDDEEMEDNEEELEKVPETLKRKKSGSSKDGKRKTESKVKTKTTGASQPSEASSVIYIGHLPSGFEENEILHFFSQFGNIVNLKVSRSKRTGNSRGHGFIQFTDEEVATIVAQTMSGYLFMGEKKLVCHVLPKDKIHPFLFRGVSLKSLALRPKKMKGHDSLVKYWQEQHRDIVNGLDTRERMTKITHRLLEKERKKRKKLAELGIDYDFPGYRTGSESKSSVVEGKSSKMTHTEIKDQKIERKNEKSTNKDDSKKDHFTVNYQEPKTKNPKSSKREKAETVSMSKDVRDTKNEADGEKLNHKSTVKTEVPGRTANKSKSSPDKSEILIPNLQQRSVRNDNVKTSTDSMEKLFKSQPNIKKGEAKSSLRESSSSDKKTFPNQKIDVRNVPINSQEKIRKITHDSSSKKNTTTKNPTIGKRITALSTNTRDDSTVQRGQVGVKNSVPNNKSTDMKKASKHQKDDFQSSLGAKPGNSSGPTITSPTSGSKASSDSKLISRNVDTTTDKPFSFVKKGETLKKEVSSGSSGTVNRSQHKMNSNIVSGINHSGSVSLSNKRKTMDDPVQKDIHPLSLTANVLKTSNIKKKRV